MRFATRTVSLAALVLVFAPSARAQNAGEALGNAKLSSSFGGFVGPLVDGDAFGRSITALPDLDGDCFSDLAIGAERDDDGGPDRGAVHIVFLNGDGTSKGNQKIGSGLGGFTGPLANGDRFGAAVAAVGDLDGDGVCDLAVGANRDASGGPERGAVWLLLLNPNGTVKAEQKISAVHGGFAGTLADGDHFGTSLAFLGDLNGDGIGDLAVGAELDDDGGANRGAVWILFLDANGTVKAEQKISATAGGFGGVLANQDTFGTALSTLPDLDGDGRDELIVGASSDDDGGPNRGAAWVLFLASDGSVTSSSKLSSLSGLGLGNNDNFGSAVTQAGDIDGDGLCDAAIGAIGDDDGNLNLGAVWIVFLKADGSMKSFQKISATSGGFSGTLDRNDNFGGALASLGDFDGDGFVDLAIGASGDDDGGTDRGAAWLVYLQAGTQVGFSFRNGSGLNPMRLTTPGTPALGAPWEVEIDCTGHAPGVLVHVGTTRPATGIFVRGGELLIDPTAALVCEMIGTHSGGIEKLTYSVPLDLSLCELHGYTQAYIGGAPFPGYTNALDFVTRR